MPVDNLIKCIIYGQTFKCYKYIETCNCEQLVINDINYNVFHCFHPG